MPSRRKRPSRIESEQATEADLPRRTRSFPLMYTPHPEKNRYPSLMPRHLADAPDRVHEIEYAHLVEMHDVLSELEALLVELNPRCVLFFATGGCPVVRTPLLQSPLQSRSLQPRCRPGLPGYVSGSAVAGLHRRITA